ncbi:cation diffusion facilitator family transporter [Comamonas kerstersii]|uniref:Cation transporter n=1 Tax=Comamonas kerstersii TaxID=225992 RepID=A0A6A1QYX8_9BURK|nr:cation diffusion facilitator family transporter [Comamonas kerstersii]KAB0583914.1 cation transporter [Comamonas kerstersii]
MSHASISADRDAAHWLTPRNLLRVSVVVAVITIVLKMLAWWLTGSVGLLSDALESFVNLAGSMFALAMVTIAQRPADEDHPYGHYKAEYFSAGFEGLLVMGASVAIVWFSVDRLLHPQPLEQLDWGMGLSLLSTVLNGALAWVMFRSARTYRSLALEGDAKHLMTDVYTSVGVVVGLLLAELTGWVWVDAVVGLLVGLNIMWHGWQLVWRSSQGLMDVAMEPQQLQVMEAVLAQQVLAAKSETGASISFDGMHTRQAGERCFVDLHLHVPGSWSLFQAAHWRERAEAALMDAIPGLQARIELLPEGANTLYEKHADEGMPPAGAM